jgi:formylglycine-generating enzyme required for sulfatase activity
MAAVILLAVLIFAGVLRQRLAEGANAERADELVARLKTVQITEVPELIREMAPYRRWAEPKLYEALQDPSLPSSQRLRASLALVDGDPEQVPFLVDQLLDSRPEELGVIRDRLAPLSASLVEPLWGVVTDPGADPSASLRAASALAAWVPADSRWRDAARRVAGLTVRESQEDLTQWRRDFQSVGTYLVSPLIDVFRRAPQTGAAPVNAAILLADYAESDKDRLADLSLEASPEQFAVLLPMLREGGQRVAARMTEELAKKAEPQWDDDASLPATRPVADVTQKIIEESLGMLTPSLAFCQTLELSAFDELAQALGECGYQPYCVRPYAVADRVQVAAAWRRTGGKWRFVYGKTAEELRAADEALREEGLIPYDVARYLPSQGAAEGETLFAGLWGQPQGNLEAAHSYVAVPDDKHPSYWDPLNKAGFVPRTNLMFHAATSEAFFTSVRWKLRPVPTPISVYFDADWQMDRAEYERRLESQRRVAHGWCQADVRLAQDLGSSESPRYSAIWWNGTPWESQELHDRSPENHRAACRALAEDRYRPAAISLGRVGETLVAASVWHRPLVPESRKDELARRQANAAVALLRLGESQTVWRLLQYQSDPRLRTYLVHRLYPMGADSRTVAEQLRKESDEGRRQALLLALALFPPADLVPLRPQLAPWLLNLYRDDPSPGVHSAAECLLRRWKLDGQLAAERLSLAGQPPRDGQRWYHTPQGHTLVLIRGPVEFVMGSTGSDDERDHQKEVTHIRRIARSFAIAAHEVTVEQYLRFQPKFTYVERYSPSPTCPINNISWYDAARYCNWLSEKEGIPPEQWCYPPDGEIRDGMELSGDHLSRAGYRLPTEAEWEYAARALTTTTRYFGHSPELVAEYSWNVDNAKVRTWPVGSLLPNAFGLFDTLGNAMEWCQNAEGQYPAEVGRVHEDDHSNDVRVSNDRYRILRGGAVLYVPSNARCAQRHRDFVDRRHPFVGFRVARTFTDATSLSPPSGQHDQGE